MIEGWVLDTHLDYASERMVLWVKNDDGSVSSHSFEWSPVLHVHGQSQHMEELRNALLRPEYQVPFGNLIIGQERQRIRHEDAGPVEVLTVGVSRPSKILRVAEMLSANGAWRNFELFSVDPKIAQRFLLDLGTFPFGRVRVEGGGIVPLDSRTDVDCPLPPLRQVKLHVACHDLHGKRCAGAEITSVTLIDIGCMGSEAEDEVWHARAEDYEEPAAFLEAFASEFDRLDPDVVITDYGDSVDFPALRALAEKEGKPLQLSRNAHDCTPRREATTSWSYGRLLRSDAYHALQGRLHIDMGTSFMGKEGGMEGLCELARVSGLPAQDLSRLSPGSAISAMQIRQSMEDGVLIPWKKNRPEDMKTATQMLFADRGGLYLDPRPGVHEDVYELDYASLFPSIIATRNISPETMSCECCNPAGTEDRRDGRLPLEAERAAREIERRSEEGEVRKLVVPELGLHVCTRRHGFLGRVVAPIIERRTYLKSKRKEKGDVWDRRQNVLKWILVCCFGYTGYRNARFGRIECHEAICAWSRDILLDTIEEAELDGWECLHAIVDSIWIADTRGRNEEERAESISRLISRIEARIGIPLELEEVYEWIAFVPNRTTGVGALTKYFAYGREGWKVRGIELRQHSTCNWVRDLQESIMEILRQDPPGEAPARGVEHLHYELARLRGGKVPLADLVVGRRVRNEVGTHRVLNLTAAALLRERSLGQRTPPGRKVRFAVVGWERPDAADRIRMESEVEARTPPTSGQSGDCDFYEPLAIRAATALLAPFGWSEDGIRGGRSVQTSLTMWA
ncbi:MAG TPA: hypothetical protein EYM62_01455 [Candidatus Poseidoniales archaeon]|nr:hypothetical protein [Candidatus Poseidoniales archaeon]